MSQNYLKTILKRPALPYVAGIAILAAAGGYVVFGRTPTYDLNYLAVARGDLVQKISVAGRVKAASEADLAFERGGKVDGVSVRSGDQIKAGQTLVVLAAADLRAQLEQAQAAVTAAQAGVAQAQAAAERERDRLDDLRRGARPEALDLQQAKIDAARDSLNEAQNGLKDKIVDAFNKADDAVRGKFDPLFLDPRTAAPQLQLFIADSQLKSGIEWQRLLAEEKLTAWQNDVAALDGLADMEAPARSAQKIIGGIRDLGRDLALALDKVSLAANPGLTPDVLAAYQLSVSAARTNLDLANASLLAGLQQLTAAQAALDMSQKELVVEQAGSSAEQIAAQSATADQAQAALTAAQAQLQAAQAARDNVQAQLAKTVITSPFDGTVTKVEAVVGEIQAAGLPAVSVISDGVYEIETMVPEADIAQAAVGEPAEVTLDAYGPDQVFAAAVSAVDPAETQQGGLSVYKVTLRFNAADPRIRSGLTANIDITTGTRQNVLWLPRQAVILRAGDPYVLRRTPNGEEDVKIATGLRGSDGRWEVASGLKEGDQVVDFGSAK